MCGVCRRGYLSVAAAAIYMASQASEYNKSQKGQLWVWHHSGLVVGFKTAPMFGKGS